MEKKLKEVLFMLGDEIAQNRSYIGELRGEGRFIDNIELERDAIAEKISNFMGIKFIK